MRNSMQLKGMFCVALMTDCAVSHAAVALLLVDDIERIPVAAFVVSVTLAVIGGAAYTTQKIADPAIVVHSIRLEIVKDILASIVAGLLTFFVCAWLSFTPFLQAACITLAGYGGSRVLEKYLKTALLRVDRLGS